jgi:hypothetical protein
MLIFGRAMPRPPQRDYSKEVAQAIAWLGERYLLARPINAVAVTRSTWRGFGGLTSARIGVLPG